MSVRASESVLRIPTHIIGAIWGHAHESFPHEACGIVTSTDRHVPMRNVSHRSLAAYQFDPAQQLEAWREMAGAGETLKIIYHSHPQRDATPSETDHALAAYPDAWYVIVSVGHQEVRAYRLSDGRLRQYPHELCLA